jgi:ADP-dependent NAD(P)H-hydrate dehydratase / NAD(P)H-hydrate epimerase
VLSDAIINAPSLWRHAIPVLQGLPTDCNKYTRGHALLWGGYPLTGASRLAARAAARMGAGLITVAVQDVALPIYATALTSVMVSPTSDLAGFDRVLADPRINALLIGPGAGATEATQHRVVTMLAKGRPIVLDADALTVFENAPEQLFRAITGPCVLTPHAGEFQRLFGTLAPPARDPDHRRWALAQKAAQRSGAVVLLKGAHTVIAAPDGRWVVNANAPPTLATAGSGDVLAGMVLGLLAQGVEPFVAAAAAVWMHGAAAAALGPGLIADDLPEGLPGIYRALSRPGET